MKSMKDIVIIGYLFLFLFISAPVSAQGVVIGLEQVREWLTSGKQVLLVDVRSPVEYRDGHIPGAINIPAERIAAEQTRLPKDRTTPLIFYCRGVG